MTAAVTLGGAIALFMWRRSQSVPARLANGMDQAADSLANDLRAQWEEAAGDRRLRYPAPVPVRWRWSREPLSGSIADTVESAYGRGFPPLPGITRAVSAEMQAGGLADLLSVYGGTQSGRLLVTGAPGSGKSSAAIMLVLDALAHRAELDDQARVKTPVPVLLTPHDWDPASQPLADWLTHRLEKEHPFLKSPDYGANAAADLVRHGRVALVMDGLDELSASVRLVALQALDEQATSMRLVVLTRPQEMLETATVRHLHGAAAIELQPVSPTEAGEYLTRCQVHPTPAEWRRLIEHVSTSPTSVVTAALDSPLMLALVRDTFPRGDRVEELLTPGRFVTREEVEAELLDRVLPAAYSTRPGQPTPRYTLAQAERWLGYISYQMRNDNTRDLTG